MRYVDVNLIILLPRGRKVQQTSWMLSGSGAKTAGNTMHAC